MNFNIKNKKEHEFRSAADTKNNGAAIEDNRGNFSIQSNLPVIQRKIFYDYPNGRFSHNGTRPAWRKSLKTWTALVYNLHNTFVPGHPNVNQAIRGSTNIGNMGLARTHKVPFREMQLILENFCNGAETPANLQAFCDIVVKPISAAYAAMVAKRQALVQARANFVNNASANNRFAVVRIANQLLGELHNSRDNILIGDSSVNSGIAERGDWNFAVAQNGQGAMTPTSAEAYHVLSTTLHQYNPGLYRPGGPGTQIASSHITSGRPTTIVPHNPAQPVFTTREWRGPGFYRYGIYNAASTNLYGPGQYQLPPP